MTENVSETRYAQESIRLDNACRVFTDFVQLKPGEAVLFVNDKSSGNTDPKLVQVLTRAVSSMGNKYTILEADENTTQGQLHAQTQEHDVVWSSWGMEEDDCKANFYDWANFIEQTGRRMVWAPGVRAQSLNPNGALGERREAIDFRLKKMEEKLRGAVGLHVETTYGTDLIVPLKQGRRWFRFDGVLKPGKWDNLPGGEVATTPDEENVEGRLFLPVLQDEVDVYQGVDEFVCLVFRQGRVAHIYGGKSADRLRSYLNERSKEETFDKRSVLQCAEVAFGANSHARGVVTNPSRTYRGRTTPTTEAEKRLGTMHIAIGSTKHGEEGVEGHTETESDSHLDFVIPRSGLTVTAYYNQDDFQRFKNGTRLIDYGGWNFLS